jgi:hypothetical protein
LHPRVVATMLQVSPEILDQSGDSGGAHSLIGGLYCRGHSSPGGVAAAMVRQRGTYGAFAFRQVFILCGSPSYWAMSKTTFLGIYVLLNFPQKIDDQYYLRPLKYYHVHNLRCTQIVDMK